MSVVSISPSTIFSVIEAVEAALPLADVALLGTAALLVLEEIGDVEDVEAMIDWRKLG